MKVTEHELSEAGTEPSEFVPADDVAVGRGVRRSVIALAVIVAIVGGVLYWSNRSNPPPPPARDTVTAPKPVVIAAHPPAVSFTDVTRASGVEFVHENGAAGRKLLPETMGAGVAIFDFDLDLDQDLLFVNGAPWPGAAPRAGASRTHALYRNDGRGHFEDVTAGSGLDVSNYGTGVAVGDYDGDSDVDVFLSALGHDHLYRNDGGGRFTDVTESAGVAGGAEDWSTSSAFFDADNDGDLDLFVCHYVRWSPEIDLAVDYRLTGVGRAYGPPMNYEGTQSAFYRNEGHGTFVEVAAAAGLHVQNPATGRAAGKALGVMPVDVDGDGWMDLLVANDTVAKNLFVNRGAQGEPGVFVEIGAQSGVAYDRNGAATGAMGVDCAWYRGDGSVVAFAIGNFANEMSSLYVAQERARLFADEAITEGIGAATRSMLTFGVLFLDYDLDGRPDLFHANGHIEDEINKVQSSQNYEQPAQFFWNCGPEAKACFAPVDPRSSGDLAHPLVGRGAAYGDLDGDGDLDLVITQAGRRPVVLRNDQMLGHHWLRVRLVGKGTNRTAIGAVVDVEAGGGVQRQQVMAAKSYLSQSELPLTFGLGAATKVELVRIRWPDGVTQTLTDVPLDRSFDVLQP